MPTDVGSSCLTGQYLSEDAVRNTLVGRTKHWERSQRVFPDIHFTCNSTITRWIIGGKMGNSNVSFVELQLWQRTDGNTYMKRSFSTIYDFNTTENNNLYHYFPNPPLEVHEGDVLGVFLPSDGESPLVMYYQLNSGPLNYGIRGGSAGSPAGEPYMSLTIGSPMPQNDYPLVSVILGEFH